MPDVSDRPQLEAVVRGIASAGKALKLYPPTSPIPMQSVDSATAALDAFLASEPVLSLAVAREGFSWHGQELGAGMVGVSDLADALRDHGVAEVDFLPGCTAADLMAFIDLITKDTEAVRAQGGFATLLAAAGIDTVRATDVQLTVLDSVSLTDADDIDEFLADLASDPDKLTAWMAAATAGDPAAFGEGLSELARSVGEQGMTRLLESLATAFMRQTNDSRDVLLGLAFDPGSLRDLTAGMFARLDDTDIASSVTDGIYGQNMLSLSNALTGLPMEQRIEQVKAHVQEMLKNGGHADKELGFLEHMVDVRRRTEPEPALVDAEQLYRKVAMASAMPAEEVDRIRREMNDSPASANRAGVKTMLVLLDQQRDFDLYCRGLDGLAAMVPRLIEAGDLDLARTVVSELTKREARAVQPWPELTGRLRAAVASAVSPAAMGALLRSVIEEPERLSIARDIVVAAGEAAGPAIIEEAVSLKTDGIKAAEDLLGRRVLDLLTAQLPKAQWFQLGPIVARLASETDPRAHAAIEAAGKRPDEQSRREVASGLAQADTTTSLSLLAKMTADASAEVAIAAVRSLSKMSTPGAAALLASRLEAIDLDNKDYLLGREMIAALARTPDPAAADALQKVLNRKALIKRGHFVEVQTLVRQALEFRAQKGAER